MAWTVAIGIDTHKDGHLAVALDRFGAGCGGVAVPAEAKGYLALWQWASALGEASFAIEGAGSYGAGLARFLVAAGADVYECERPRRAERRGGKSDLIDATLAASRLLSGAPLARLRGDGVREDLRLLLLERRGAIQPARPPSTRCRQCSSPLPKECERAFVGSPASNLPPP